MFTGSCRKWRPIRLPYGTEPKIQSPGLVFCFLVQMLLQYLDLFQFIWLENPYSDIPSCNHYDELSLTLSSMSQDVFICWWPIFPRCLCSHRCSPLCSAVYCHNFELPLKSRGVWITPHPQKTKSMLLFRRRDTINDHFERMWFNSWPAED